MQGVSGITGAGPLLHRVIMATARRVPPGSLATPAEAGAVAVPICRLSGLRATDRCAQLAEWFAPGTEPTQVDDWERDGRVSLPAEYADWSQQGLTPVARASLLASGRSVHAPHALYTPDSARAPAFRIVSPMDGDRYAIPVGVESRYATIPLRAGGRAARPGRVRWSIDGRSYTGERWALELGTHVVRATSSDGDVAEARIVVEP